MRKSDGPWSLLRCSAAPLTPQPLDVDAGSLEVEFGTHAPGREPSEDAPGDLRPAVEGLVNEPMRHGFSFRLGFGPEQESGDGWETPYRASSQFSERHGGWPIGVGAATTFSCADGTPSVAIGARATLNLPAQPFWKRLRSVSYSLPWSVCVDQLGRGVGHCARPLAFLGLRPQAVAFSNHQVHEYNDADKDGHMPTEARHRARELTHRLTDLCARVTAAEDGSLEDLGPEFTRGLRDLGRQIETWTPELAELFDEAARALCIGGFYGLQDLLGTEGATALQAALGINADYTPRCTVPGAKNGFSGNGTLKQIAAHNDRLALRFRVTTARRQRGSHLGSSRQRERRAANPRRRGSRRSAGTRAGPRSDDDPGGDPEPDHGHLDDPTARAVR